MSKTVLVINGPNLNLLGTREPDIYGHETLSDIEKNVRKHAAHLDLVIEFLQSNHEGEIVTWIQDARGTENSRRFDALVINAAAYTHTSVAIGDAIKAVAIPTWEVHLSNVYKRESFRHHSFISGAAEGVIAGLGSFGYIAALESVKRYLT